MKSLKATLTTFSKIQVIGQRICETCGSSVPIVKDHKGEEISDCLACENKALEREMTDYKVQMDNQRDEQITAQFERYSLIPDDLQTATFENYIPDHDSKKDALKKCQWFAENFDNLTGFHSLLLKGGYGLGKSHLSHSITKYLKEQGKKVIFIDTPSLLRMIRQSFNDHSFSESEIYRLCAEADLLVLDDIGAEYVKQENGKESWASEVLFQIITSRMDKPKVFTTNLSSKELSNKYGVHGGRIVSRMMKGTRLVEMEGKDYRTQAW
ncbi:ATP-binding protein [Bacillus cihuensis]|uniref:ATP-binding protein n=1 Tax=Bacillus cihuensis TaxID=1208599 RepID=UPI00041EB01C|nr:ATP-binding protein [Bacillus cihuensis]